MALLHIINIILVNSLLLAQCQVFPGSPGIKDASEGDNLLLIWTLSQPYGTNEHFKIFQGVPSDPGPDANYILWQTSHVTPCSKPPSVTKDVDCYFSGNDIGFSFNNVKKTDAGNYSCYHQLLSTLEELFDSAALIYVIGQPTSAVLDPQSPTVVEGQDIDIVCQSQSTSEPENYRPDPPLIFTWYRGDVNISDTPPSRHVITGNKLTIQDVNRTDSSFNYSCMSREPGRLQSNHSSAVYINVTYVPGQATAAQDTVGEIFEGTVVSLQCSVTDPGNPHWHQYIWTKDGVDKGVTNGASFQIPEGNLTVADHDGNWTCRAVNSVGAGSHADIKVNVFAIPQVLGPSPDTVISLAENVSSLNVLCSIRGKPPPIVIWSLGSGNLPDGVVFVDDGSSETNKLTTVRKRLQWFPGSTLAVRRQTGGRYTCRGTILTQSDDVTLEVDVQYGPFGTSITPAGNITVVENTTVTLTCTANCNPACAYEWTFGSDNPQVGGELIIDYIKRDKEGWYICTAQNGRGQDTQQHIHVAVHYPPDISITINPSGDVVKGMDVKVLCVVDSRPPDNTITWTNVTGGHPPYYDDSSNTTHSWITITDIDILDTGELRCTADNGVSGSPRSWQRYMEVLGPARVHQTHPTNNRTGAGIGDHVSFQVSIIARPMPYSGDWSWMFVSENLIAELSVPAGVELIVNQDLATLFISNITTEHFGNYSLLTSNSYGGWDPGDVVFELFASGPPSRPTDFRAVRVTAVSITVEWMTGFDGGLPQTFTINYRNIHSGDEGEMSDIPDECSSEGCIIQRKITEGIADDTEYELQIRADNGKGQAMGDTITVSTPVRASLPQPAKISLGDTDAEITFSVIGQLTAVTIHHCVTDTENCKDDKFPILTPQQNNQGRGRRQARDTMHNFSQTVDLLDPSASSFAFQFMLHDGDDVIYNTASIVIERIGTNIGAIIGGVIGGLVLAALVVVLVLWRRGIIFQKEKGDNKQISQEREYVNAVGPQALSTIYHDIPADVKEPNTYEGLMETNISQETSTYAGLAQTTLKTFNTSNMNVLGVINEGAFYRVSVVSITSTHQERLPNRLVMKTTKDALMYPVHNEYLEGAAKAMVELVNCDNIMRCLGVDSSMTGLLLQHVPHGTLRQYLTGLCDNTYINSTNNQNRDLIHFIHQAANGAAAVAELMPENLFYCLSLDHVLLGKNLNVKLTGFSLAQSVIAREVVEDKNKLSRPLRWLSPEAIDLQHTTQSDVWGFAVLIWEILSQGRIPFEGIADADIRSHIRAGHRLTKPPPCTDDMFDMMSECWKLKARSRPTMASVKSLLHEMTVYQNV